MAGFKGENLAAINFDWLSGVMNTRPGTFIRTVGLNLIHFLRSLLQLRRLGLDSLKAHSRTTWLTLLHLFLLLCGITTAQALPVTAFEPTNFTRGSGVPVVERHNFFTEHLNGYFILTVHNGGLLNDESGGEFVSSSTISLNGVLVIGPQNFNQNTTTISVPVTLASANELAVELRGKQGSVITVEITGNVNNAPVADAGINQSVAVGSTVNLDGSASFDVDGDALNYQWVFVAKPTASQITLSNATTDSATFTADVEGNFVLGLVVNDGQLDSSQSQIYISALAPNTAPTLSPVGDQTVALGTTVNFNLTATDPEGDQLSYSIQPLPLPEGMSLDAVSGAFRFKPNAMQAGNYSITFLVSDGAATDVETIVITVPAADQSAATRISGRLLDAIANAQGIVQPIVGGTVGLLNSSETAISDSGGYFSLSTLVDGSQVLDINNATAQAAPDGSSYAGFREKIDLIANVENVIERPIYLPRIAANSLTTIDPNTTTQVENAELGISLTVPPHTAMNENGTEFTGQLSISLVPKGLEPAALPANLQFGQLVTLQPLGVSFDTPVAITFPNIDNLVAGSETNLWSIDPIIGEFTIVGTGQVTADGLFIETISDGIRATDWHAQSSPHTSGAPDTDNPSCGCGHEEPDSGSSVNTRLGWLKTDFALPSYQSLSNDRSLSFIYRSEQAYPKPVVPFDYTIPVRSAVPPTISYGVSVGGVAQNEHTFISTAGLSESIDENLHTAVQIDGTMLPTGIYPYNITLQSNYPFTSVGTNIVGEINIVNKQSGSFGAGWSLAGLNRLVATGNDSVLIVDGSGRQSVFTRNAVGFIVYDNDFEAGADAQWSNQTTSETPIFTNFLGRFGKPTGTVSLSLNDLPAHTGVELLLDFYAIDSWDGDGLTVGPDKFRVGFDGNISGLFDEFIPNNKYASVGGQFGYTFWSDSIYSNLNDGFYFEHGNSELTLNFTAQLTATIPDESAGIDNIRVAVGQIETLADFETGSVGSFDSSGMDGGIALVVQEGTLFSSGSDTTIIDMPGTYAVNIRSKAVANVGSIGILTSPLFTAGDRLMFRERSESDNVNIELRILNENGDVLLSQSIPPTLGTFRLHTINTVQFAGQQIKVQFRQNSLQMAGWYTLVDNIKIFFGVPENQETEYTSSDGDFSTLIRNIDGSYTRTLKNGTQVHFDANGLQTDVIDRNGNITLYTYDIDQQLSSITDPIGKVTTFSYQNNQLNAVTDPAGRISSFDYDTDNNLIKVTFPDGTTKRFGYNHQHLMTLEADQLNRTTVREFDFAGRLKSSTRADGTARSMTTMKTHGLVDPDSGTGTPSNPAPFTRPDNNISTFTDGNGESNISETDGYGRLTRRTDANGLTTLTDRDVDGNPIKTKRPDLSEIHRIYDELGNLISSSEGFNGATTETNYDPQFNLVTSVTDARDNTTTYTRNPATGNLETITNALGHQTQMSHNAAGQLIQSTDANGLVTTYGYNADGLIVTLTETPPVGGGQTRSTTMTYDAAGQTKSITTPDSIVQTMEYDVLGRLISVSDNLNQRVEYVYDAVGNRIHSKTLEGDGTLASTLVQSFDALNRRIATIQPHISGLDSIQQFEYDGAGNLDSAIDPKGQESNRQYDPGNRLISQIDALVGTTLVAYDDNGNLIRVVAANGVQTDYQVDSLGRIVSEISPDRGTLSYTYDLNNNLKTLIDARGIIRSYDYDALNRLTAVSFPNTQENVSISYDNCSFGIGRICSFTDESGTTSMQYDVYGNVITINYTRDGVNYSQSYSYDIGHRISSMTLPSGRVVSYQRDGVQRISQISSTINGQNQIILDQIGYNANHQITQRTYGNGLAESRFYDLQSRLINSQLTGTDETNLSYDANSNVLSRNTTSDDHSYGYDALDRLQTEINNGSDTSYQYDPNGNRLNQLEGAQSTDYAYSLQSNILDTIDGQILSHDDAGNLIIDQHGRDLIYNDAGRLIEIHSNGQILAEYRYSSNGQRTHKITSAKTTIYHYDLTGNLISETTDTGTPIRDYLWQQGQPVAQIDSDSNQTETINYIHTDHLNTPRLATNPNQAITWRWESKAFGNTQAQSFGATINLRFPGQYFDGESGLHYNYFRDYDPGLGRYIESDPVGLRSGLNNYSYANESPIVLTDPLGLNPILGFHIGRALSKDRSNVWVGGQAIVGLGIVGAYTGGVLQMTNASTGETCSLSYVSIRFPAITAAVTTRAVIWPSGPRCGKDLNGKNIEFGVEVQSPGIGTPGFSAGIGVGSSGPGVGGSGGRVGFGAGVSAFLGIELSNISVLGCLNTPCECQ